MQTGGVSGACEPGALRFKSPTIAPQGGSIGFFFFPMMLCTINKKHINRGSSPNLNEYVWPQTLIHPGVLQIKQPRLWKDASFSDLFLSSSNPPTPIPNRPPNGCFLLGGGDRKMRGATSYMFFPLWQSSHRSDVASDFICELCDKYCKINQIWDTLCTKG